MFCRNCGKELIGMPGLCLNCGARPLAGSSFCPGCGAQTSPVAEICIKCGARLVMPAGAKRTAMPIAAGILSIIAGFLGFFLGIFLATIMEATWWEEGAFGFGLFFGVPIIIFGIIAIVGGVYALRRRIWGLALAGSICAFLGAWFLGIPAIILIALSKKEFK